MEGKDATGAVCLLRTIIIGHSLKVSGDLCLCFNDYTGHLMG